MILPAVQTKEKEKRERVIKSIASGEFNSFLLVNKKMVWLYDPVGLIFGYWPHVALSYALLFQEKCGKYNQKAESK